MNRHLFLIFIFEHQSSTPNTSTFTVLHNNKKTWAHMRQARLNYLLKNDEIRYAGKTEKQYLPIILSWFVFRKHFYLQIDIVHEADIIFHYTTLSNTLSIILWTHFVVHCICDEFRGLKLVVHREKQIVFFFFKFHFLDLKSPWWKYFYSKNK